MLLREYPAKYNLTSLLWALILQKILSIPTDTLLLTILNISRELREFCGFSKIPDASKITRFKQEFSDDLACFFEDLVDITEPILQEIDAEKASMSIFDTTGLEAYVTENNPKYVNQKIRSLKSDYAVNTSGVPCFPHDPTLAMKPEGNTSNLRCGLKTYKFVCPKMSLIFHYYLIMVSTTFF